MSYIASVSQWAGRPVCPVYPATALVPQKLLQVKRNERKDGAISK